LDSEEATYSWRSYKTRESLKQKLSELEIILKEIKQSGRQQYLSKDKEDFTRILHDYADPQKGFVNCKSALDQQLGNRQ
jgi:dsDNA-binding SOS-regulon protein